MKRFYLTACAVGLTLLSTSLHAQSFLSTAKGAAATAVQASNAQTAAEQNTSDPQPSSVVITAAPKPPKYAPVVVASNAPAPAKVQTPVKVQAPVKAPVPVLAPAPTPALKPVPPTVSAPEMTSAPSTDSSARTVSVTERGTKGEVSLNREVYSYTSGGRRDPFVSLMVNGDLRPLITDLRLVAVLYDPTGANSIAVLHDIGAQQTVQYRVRVGQTLGRMRVTQIEPKQVVFTIEQVGFSRQETLALGDSTTTRTQ